VHTVLGLLLLIILFVATIAWGSRPIAYRLVLSFALLLWSVLVVGFAGWCHVRMPCHQRVGIRASKRRIALALGAFAVLVYGGVSALEWSVDTVWSGQSLFMWAGPIVLVPAVAMWCQDIDFFRFSADRLTTWFAFGGFSWVIIGLLLWGWPSNPLHAWLAKQSWPHGKVFATIDYHGNAGTLIVLTAIWLSLWVSGRKYAWRWSVLLLPILIASVINASRTGMIMVPVAVLAAIGIAWWGQYQRDHHDGALSLGRGWAFRQIISVGLCSVFIGGALIGAGYAFWDRLQGSAIDRLSTWVSEVKPEHYPRWMEMEAAWRLIQSRPFVGYGVGSYPAVSAEEPGIQDHFFAPSPLSRDAFNSLHHANSDPMEVWVEWGAVGWMLLVWPVGWAMARSWRVALGARVNQSTQCLMLGVALSLTAVVLHGLIDCTLQLPVILALFSVLVGIGCAWPIVCFTGIKQEGGC